jgi:hypothetical protein
MKSSCAPRPSRPRHDPGLFARALTALRIAVSLPFKIAGRVVKHFAQVVLALFVIILHPQIKWILKLISESSLVRNYIRPSLRTFSVSYYEPYFAYLHELPPYWATFSIALPLAILEPAKLYATILVAEHPKLGILLWLCLQGLSFVLIDRTWSAVRPQSRKIRLVSRLHAWGWLNVSHGKYWIKSSSFYQALMRWKGRVQLTAQALLARYAPRRGGKTR